ncbi:MAG: SCP2 sterol-binding domain-containing protein [Actinomycetota bacterium]
MPPAAPEFLGPDWVGALDAAVREAPDLADAADPPVVIEQRVVTDDGEVAYHLVLGPGPARVRAGRAAVADLTMIATAEAARQLHAGDANAQQCLADGTLRLRGNPDVLTRRAAALARVGVLLRPPGSG